MTHAPSDAARPLAYRDAGVDIAAADDAKARFRALVESTRTPGVRGAFGGFGGMFRAPDGYRNAVLVSSADSVGTKVKVAIEAGRFDSVGHDLVNHCVNDILVQGATPLFFLDYIGTGKLEPDVAESIVAGVAAGCRENGCALVGGETAELPGLYQPHDFDLAGFIVGCVEEEAILGADRVREGDVLVGLESSGLHTNGYSLARRIVADRMHLSAADAFPGANASVAEVLLAVHRSYLACMTPVLAFVHAMAHITGGGIPGNLNRVLPPTLDAEVQLGSWPVTPVFETLARAGGVAREEMYRAFNMGLGLVVVVPPDGSERVLATASDAGVRGWRVGRVTRGAGRVQLMEA